MLLVLCLTLLAVFACAGDGATPDDAPDRVRAVVLPFLTQASLQIAADEGYFAAHDLDVEFVRLARIQDLNTALARGEVDVAAGMFTVSLMNTVARGGRLRMVATLGHLAADRCPFHAWVTRRELVESGAVEDAARLRELTFDTDLLLPEAYWLDVALASSGVALDAVDVVDIPPTASAEALARDSIDVAALPQPMLDMATDSEELVVWRGSNEIVPGYPISLLMYGPTLLDERPGIGERFLAAMLDALEQYRLGKTDRNRAIVERFTGLDPERVAITCWPSPPESARVEYGPLLDYQRWAVEQGLAERILPEDELVDHRFIDAVTADVPE